MNEESWDRKQQSEEKVSRGNREKRGAGRKGESGNRGVGGEVSREIGEQEEKVSQGEEGSRRKKEGEGS